MRKSYKTLTNDEYEVLKKIAKKTKMDCWFLIKQDLNGADYIWDLEEGKRLCLRTGVGMLVDGLDCVENYDNCMLTEEEAKVFEELLGKLNIPLCFYVPF